MNLQLPIQTQGRQEEEGKEEQEHEDEKARCEWDFDLRTVISSGGTQASSDTISATEFDPSDQLLATGGIARKIRIYSLKSLLQYDASRGTSLLDHVSACDYYICTPAKLSSLRWKPSVNSRVVGSGDYDGVVTEYDLERCMPSFERDEHGGRRIWSLDYSQSIPAIGASGSDDGTMQMWDTRSDGTDSVAVVRPSVSGSAVCCVEFDRYGGDLNLIAVGCADRRAYVYDIRNVSNPVSVFHGHQKTVSYVRFLGEGMMVSAATDGFLKLWNTNDAQTLRTYKGHSNTRNFVGLSVWRNGGLFGCGSESNEVFVYDKRWGNPMWVHGLEPMVAATLEQRFVSSVCWRQVGDDECTLVAGGSDGVLQVFVGERKSPLSGFSHSPAL